MPDKRGFWEVDAEERRASWDKLYDTPGFAIMQATFPEIFYDERANKEMSEYIADRIRGRVNDPVIAEKLIPKDHGFATQRLPLETRYFEAYNRDNVELVDVTETPIEKITTTGIQTSTEHYDLDVIIYATGFDAITGAWDRLGVEGVEGEKLADKWRDGPSTYLGILTHGYPNLFMVAGPQSISGTTNFPRAIEGGVNWITDLLRHARSENVTRLEVDREAEHGWGAEVIKAHERLLLRRSKSWFTGYNPNVEGHNDASRVRYQAYFGGGPKYMKFASEEARKGYPHVTMS